MAHKICMCMCMCIYIYIYIRIYTHTHTHTHTHIHIYTYSIYTYTVYIQYIHTSIYIYKFCICLFMLLKRSFRDHKFSIIDQVLTFSQLYYIFIYLQHFKVIYKTLILMRNDWVHIELSHLTETLVCCQIWAQWDIIETSLRLLWCFF